MQKVYFSKNLKYLTDNTIITQSELSRLLGISRQAVHNLIVKDSDCRLSTIMKISDVYDIDPSDLMFVDLELKYNGKLPVYKKTTIIKKEDKVDA
ncbi:MAG: helix-turn-helix transcriptional regulator [Acholeplasmatales bacterium]|nr:helix-turn-helix transcriptional regulator [Acholeplasmatales bacterium]